MYTHNSTYCVLSFLFVQRKNRKRKKLTKKQAAVKAPPEPESEGESSGLETPTRLQEDGSEDENRTPENNGAARKVRVLI